MIIIIVLYEREMSKNEYSKTLLITITKSIKNLNKKKIKLSKK